MNLIKDVREELLQLDLSAKPLRHFAWLMAGVLFIIAGWQFLTKGMVIITWILLVLAIIFLILSFKSQNPFLNLFYRLWMSLAFIVGWFVSRILLTFEE